MIKTKSNSRPFFSGMDILLASLCLAMLLLLAAGGCAGGGSSGTGTTLVSGSLRSAENAPIAGAQVIIVETGSTVVTDDSGDFSIETEISSNQLTIGVDAEGSSGSVEISDIPDDTVQVSVELEFSPETSALTADKVEFSRRGGNNNDNGDDDSDNQGDPSPDVTPEPAESPTPTPTPESDSSSSGLDPDITPEPSPTPEPTPTATPPLDPPVDGPTCRIDPTSNGDIFGKEASGCTEASRR